MSDQPDNPQSTPMDRKVDQTVKTVAPPNEQYSNSALGKLPLADKREMLSDTEPSRLGSWTISEIERSLSNNLLKPSSLKLDQFAQNINRKNDMRLRNLSRQIGNTLERDFTKQAATPNKRTIKPYDVQSQTMRMVTANASMGTYQFQKTLVLPYMRKSLALGYQKVSLLKDIVGGITSMEKAVVAKLEAIKINTASTAPRQKSYFKRLMDDVGFLNMRRVAGNISNYTMDGYEKLYRKFVSPATLKVHRLMSSERRQDGVNGVRRALTGKLNSLRRSARDAATVDLGQASRLDRLKARGASVASKLLGGSVRATQQVRLGDARNRSITDWLKTPAEDLAKFNPFSSKGPIQIDQEDDGTRVGVVTPTPLNQDIKITSQDGNLLTAFKQWVSDYRRDHDIIIKQLEQINAKTGGITDARRTSRSGRQTVPTSGPAPVAPLRANRRRAVTIDDIVAAAGPTTGPKTLGDQITGIPSAAVNPDALPNIPETERSRTTIGAKLRAVRDDSYDKVTGFSSAFKKALAPLYHREITASVAAPVPTPPVPTPSFGGDDTKLDRTFFTAMFEKLGMKVQQVSSTVETGNEARTKFEKVQTKWKEISDKLRPKEIRKNSYEDVQRQRQERGKGLLGRTLDRTKNAALTAGAKLLSGNLVGAGGSILSDIFGWAKDEIGEKIGDKISEKTGELWDRGKRRARIRGRRSLRGLRRRFGLSRSGVGSGPPDIIDDITDASPPEPRQRRSLARRARSLAGRGIRAGGRAGGSLLLRGGKSLLKGGLSLAKGAAPAAIATIGADYARDWFDKNTDGATKRAGTTLATAASWGATGATIGSVIPGVGTLAGGAIGALAGVIAENTDLVSSGLSKLGNAASGSASFLWTSLFGKDAKLDEWGRVKEQEKPSLLRNMAGSIFGLDAKYSKSGDIVQPGKTGLIPFLYQGTEKFFFGTKDEQKKYKPGSSILEQMSVAITANLLDFKKAMEALPGNIMSLFEGLKSRAGNVLSQGADAVSGFFGGGNNTPVSAPPGDVYKGKGTPVADAKSVAEQLIPGIRITSHKRAAGQAGKAGGNSWHVKSGAAIDVAPVPGMDFESFKKKFTDAGYPLIEAIDETKAATMAKTGATGKHWHIVLGQPTAAPNANAGYTGPGGSGVFNAQNSAAIGTGPMKGGFVSNDARARFNDAVNYLTQKKGWSRVAAIGIAGNLFGESGLKPGSFNKAGGGQGAQGIAQWRGPRIKDIEAKFGKKIGDMSLYEQLDAVDFELRDGKHVTSSNAIPNGTGSIVDAINKSPSMEQVVQQMVYRYERPSTNPGALAQETQKRIAQANSIVGASGSNAPQPAKGPVQQAATKKQETGTKLATAKPAANKAPMKTAAAKPSAAPSPVVDSSAIAGLTDALNSWGTKLSDTKQAGNTVNVNTNAPKLLANKTPAKNGISLAKERVRTGA